VDGGSRGDQSLRLEGGKKPSPSLTARDEREGENLIDRRKFMTRPGRKEKVGPKRPEGGRTKRMSRGEKLVQ